MAVSDVINSLKELVDWLRFWKHRTAASLTGFIGSANIVGRVYIEDNIAQEEIAPDLMSILNQFYASWIVCALGLNEMCCGGQTVRQRLELVATEGYNTSVTDHILEGFGSNNAKPMVSTEAAVVKLDEATQRLVNGRLIELEFQGEGMRDKVKANIHVQLVPHIIDTLVSEGFMSVNFVPPISARIKAMRAGEISFIKDFIFARDLIKRQSEALKKDDQGMLLEMMSRQRNQLFKWAANLIGILPETHNLSNAIVIVNKMTFDKVCRNAHVDFDNFLQRTKFFAKTYTMGVVVVDPMYGKVTMYFAGMPQVGTYSFEMVKKVGFKKESFDLKEIMTAFAQGAAPRF